SFGVLEAESWLAREGGAGKRRTPELLDVFYDEFRAGKMTDLRRLVRVVHRVRHIAKQRHVLADVDHLPDREWPPEHTHVQVHATKDDVVDAALGEQVPGFLAVVGNGVLRGNLNCRSLPRPGFADFAFHLAIATHVGFVNWQRGFAFGIGPAPGGAPTIGGRERHWRGCKRRGQRALALRSVLVKGGYAAWRVDYEDAFAADNPDHLIHRAGEFADAERGGLAPVVVPHVANDEGHLIGWPHGVRLGDGARVRASSRLGTGAEWKMELGIGAVHISCGSQQTHEPANHGGEDCSAHKHQGA